MSETQTKAAPKKAPAPVAEKTTMTVKVRHKGDGLIVSDAESAKGETPFYAEGDVFEADIEVAKKLIALDFVDPVND